MINAANASMGFLRSLYYEQMKKSIADARKQEAKERMEKANADKNRAKQLRAEASAMYRTDPRRRPKHQPRQQQPEPSTSSSYNVSDIQDALEELE